MYIIMDNIVVNIDNPNIDFITLQKMALLYNSLENGWTIKKNKNCYVFNKKHEGKKEVFLDSYLKGFMEENMDLNKIILENSNENEN